jgi:hypothetical protein
MRPERCPECWRPMDFTSADFDQDGECEMPDFWRCGPCDLVFRCYAETTYSGRSCKELNTAGGNLQDATARR